MHYIATTLGTDLQESARPVPIWFRAMRRLLPSANPDIEPLFSQVRQWWIETDGDGRPEREVGLDSTGSPVVAAPFAENMGFWTDANLTLSPSDHDNVDAQAFEAAWLAFFEQWKTLQSRPQSRIT